MNLERLNGTFDVHLGDIIMMSDNSPTPLNSCIILLRNEKGFIVLELASPNQDHIGKNYVHSDELINNRVKDHTWIMCLVSRRGAFKKALEKEENKDDW